MSDRNEILHGNEERMRKKEIMRKQLEQLIPKVHINYDHAKKFEVSEENQLEDILDWIKTIVKDHHSLSEKQLEITVEIKSKPNPCDSEWNHSSDHSIFARRTCPICGAEIPRDHGIGQMEISEHCPENRKHYSSFTNIFASSVTILGKNFSDDKVEEIDAFLNEVGNVK